MVDCIGAQCQNAKNKNCNCKCGGKLHGRESGNLTEEQEGLIQNLAVGDIVICHGWNNTEGKKGFIEEIIVDQGGKMKPTGQFSIYGLEPVKFSTGEPSLYFGDYIGYQLEPNGGRMTVGLLQDYIEEHKSNKGLVKDIEIVIKNLGRTSGRNEPARAVGAFEVNKTA